MKFGFGVIAVAALAVAGSAGAQTPQAAPAAAPAQSAPSGPVTPAEIASFARATIKLHTLQAPTPDQMAATITGAGITVERYNDIAGRMQKDPAFASQVNAALVQATTEARAAGAAPAGPAAPVEPPPPLPTSGPGASVLTILDKVCVPMVHQNQTLEAVGPQAGLKLNKREGTFNGVLGQAPYSVSVQPRGADRVCTVQIRYAPDSGNDIAKALNIWTMHQNPELKMVRNDVAVGADGLKRTTLSWDRTASGQSAGLVFVRVERPDGTPVEKGVGSATLLYTESGS